MARDLFERDGPPISVHESTSTGLRFSVRDWRSFERLNKGEVVKKPTVGPRGLLIVGVESGDKIALDQLGFGLEEVFVPQIERGSLPFLGMLVDSPAYLEILRELAFRPLGEVRTGRYHFQPIYNDSRLKVVRLSLPTQMIFAQ